MRQPFKLLYFAGIVGQIIIRMPYERERRQRPMADSRVSGLERALFGLLSLAMFGLPALYAATRRLDFADYPLAPESRRRLGRLGAALLAASLWLFWRSHRDLDANWSPSLEIGAGHALVTDGVYRSIRHPMYASYWLWALAQALLLPNWLAGGGSLAAFLALYRLRVPAEERMMRDHFGAAYEAYAARTGRILPRLRG
ncbi:MAG TPA: protein-S-isoprenylcysteine O-methyltransferase [Herpetosiphonaceae bacterium]